MATAIRRATPQDAPAAAEVFLASRATMTYLPHLHSDDETRSFIARVVGESETWIAERDGAVVGFAVIHEGWLFHLYVHPSRFNSNTGSRLFEQVCEKHPEGFQLWAFQQNVGARRFYERHGCALVRLTNGAENEEKLPDALYVWPATGKARTA
jgi:ribosomal protein S18 acetylase RimI-like enzyme